MFITDSPAGEIYGFPVYGVPGLKIANHAGGEIVDPETVDRSTDLGKTGIVSSWPRGCFPGSGHVWSRARSVFTP